MATMWEQLGTRLEGRMVVLEPLRREHEDGLRAAAADDRIWCLMWTDEPERWLRHALAEAEAGVRVPFAILVDAAPVGSSSYLSLAPEHRRLEIGHTWMNPSTWGTGANAEAKYLLLRHAFEDWDAMRVEFKTDARNLRVRGALLGVGASFEGIFRKHMRLADSIRDSAWYAVVDDDWPRVKAMLEEKIERHAP